MLTRLFYFGISAGENQNTNQAGKKNFHFLCKILTKKIIIGKAFEKPQRLCD